MPRYDVECQDAECRQIEEIVLGMNDTVIPPCPLCGSVRKKLMPFVSMSVQGEPATRYAKWFYSDKTQARLRLPDSHPESLRPVAKTDDVMHL